MWKVGKRKVDVKYASATFCLRCPHARRPSRQCSSTVFLASDFVVHRFFQETKPFHTSIEHPVGTTLQNYSNFKRMNQGTTNSQVLHRDLADGTQDNSWQLTLRDRWWSAIFARLDFCTFVLAIPLSFIRSASLESYILRGGYQVPLKDTFCMLLTALFQPATMTVSLQLKRIQVESENSIRDVFDPFDAK